LTLRIGREASLRRPSFPGEDEAGYARLSAQFLAAVKPIDFVEELLLRDAIDLTWGIFRLRRMKAGLLRMAAGKGVHKIFSKIGCYVPGPDGINGFIEEWARGKVSARREIAEILRKAGLTMDDVMAEALAEEIDSFEHFDCMLAKVEVRRNNALHEIERHRLALGAAMRQVIEKVQDAEFRDVETREVS
jgi:hypothetical protein